MRPQENFRIDKDKQRDLVIDSIRKGRPLNIMYWTKTGNDIYEVLDGQQRTISIAQYVNKDFPIKVNENDKFFQNLTDTERDQILNYELTVYIAKVRKKKSWNGSRSSILQARL